MFWGSQRNIFIDYLQNTRKISLLNILYFNNWQELLTDWTKKGKLELVLGWKKFNWTLKLLELLMDILMVNGLKDLKEYCIKCL